MTANDTRMTPHAETIDIERIREDFPALHQRIWDRPLVYLDNAATAQKPRVVIDALQHFYEKNCSNVHRGIHQLSQRATEDYERARSKLQRFLNAASSQEIVFVRGTTEAINLVAETYGRQNVGADGEILITTMEHHSNIVPWQILSQQTGAALKVAPIDDRGELILEEFDRLLSPRTRLVSIAHASNALGTINPLSKIIDRAHCVGAVVVIDGAQAAPHFQVDVRALDCDFYAFSGHKTYGPTGIGVLYGKRRHLESMPPYQGGGEMILSVTFEKTIYKEPPYKFEAGTPNIAGAIGLGAAVDYINAIGLDWISRREATLLGYANDAFATLDGVRLIGRADDKTGILSFVVEGVHPHDVGTILDRESIAVRTGHHCAQPVMDRFGVAATTRASLGLYNTESEIDSLVEAIRKVRRLFAA